MTTDPARRSVPVELRFGVDTTDAPLAFADSAPEVTDLAVEVPGDHGLLATLVLPIGDARQWAGDLFTAISVAYREITGDPHALTDDELAGLAPVEYQPGAGVLVHGDDREAARARFHIDIEIEAEFLSTGGLRAGLVEALTERFNTTRLAVSAGQPTAGTVWQFPTTD